MPHLLAVSKTVCVGVGRLSLCPYRTPTIPLGYPDEHTPSRLHCQQFPPLGCPCRRRLGMSFVADRAGLRKRDHAAAGVARRSELACVPGGATGPHGASTRRFGAIATRVCRAHCTAGGDLVARCRSQRVGPSSGGYGRRGARRKFPAGTGSFRQLNRTFRAAFGSSGRSSRGRCERSTAIRGADGRAPTVSGRAAVVCDSWVGSRIRTLRCGRHR